MPLFKPKLEKLKQTRDVPGLFRLLDEGDPALRSRAAEALIDVAESDETAAIALGEQLVTRPGSMGIFIASEYGPRLLLAGLRHPSPEFRQQLAEVIVSRAGDLTNYLNPVRLLGAGSPDVQSAVDAWFSQQFAAAERKARRALDRPWPWSPQDLEDLYLVPTEAAQVLVAQIEQDPRTVTRLAWNKELCRIFVRAVESGSPEGERAGSRGLRFILGIAGRQARRIGRRSPGDSFDSDIVLEARRCLDKLAKKLGVSPADIREADVKDLIEKLDVAHSARLDIVAELGRRGDPVAIAPLLEVMRDSLAENDRKIADGVTKALEHIGGSNEDALLIGLEHEDPTVRWTIANVLAAVGDVGVVPRLEQALNDSDEYVREAVGVALERIAFRA